MYSGGHSELQAARRLLWSDLRTQQRPSDAPAFDLPVAANVIEWVASEKFLGFPNLFGSPGWTPKNLTPEITPPHWGQYQLLRDICQLRCPVCNAFDPTGDGPANPWGKTRAELEDEVLLRWTPGGFQCPQCSGTREDFLADGLIQDYNTALAVIGMRSGKSASAGLYATYVDHMICCAAGFERDVLTRKLGQARGTTFDIAFVATTGDQAEATIWDYYTNFRGRSPWFQRYVSRIKELEKTQPKAGIKPWKYTENDREISNDLIGLTLRSLHSNSAGMAGATRLAGFIDELARFDTTESKRGADEVWRVIYASLQTIRTAAKRLSLPGFVWGLRLAISSPISIDDKAMTMLSKAEDPRLDRMYAIHLPTWEFNPHQPRENFDEAYAEDAIAAERDFGANPPLTETPLIEDVPRFATSITYDNSPAVLFRPTYPEDKVGNQYVGVEVTDAIISPEAPRFIFFDAGESFDAFSGAMAHPAWVEVAPDPEDEDRRPRRVLITVYDWVIRILPTEKPKRTVWFDSVVKIIQDIKDNFRIVRVCFDRWNSPSLIQHIRTLGVASEQAKLEVKDYTGFRSDCYSGKIKLLPPEGDELKFVGNKLVLTRNPPDLTAAAAGIYELVKLSRDEKLKKVFNPLKGKKRGYDSDDTAQVLVGTHKLVQAAMSDDPAKKGRKERLRREQMGGETWGGGGVVQAMRHWSVQPPVPRPGGGAPRPTPPISRRRGGGFPGYTPDDTFIMDPSGNPVQPTRAHEFRKNPSVVRIKRW